MKKLVILMGNIAAYKSTIAKRLSGDLNLILFYKDLIKEVLCDEIGYDNREQNKKLSRAAFSMILLNTKSVLEREHSLMIESNFKLDELQKLLSYTKENNLETMILFFTGKPEVLYQRYLLRQPSRHKAHTSTGLMSYDMFEKSCLDFNMIEHNHAHLVDTTFFDDMKYQELLDIVRDFLFNGNFY